MKRLLFILLLAPIFVILVSCSKQTTIELSFSSTDVKEIEVYHFSVPAQAEKMLVTSETDIEKIIAMLTSIEVKENKLEAVSGTDTTSFRFNLTDGTDFEIIFVSYGVKKGVIKSSYVFDYQTAADVGSVWRTYDYEKISVEENQLPSYEQ